jgi:transcriptional regulator with XRE-family HTH domain
MQLGKKIREIREARGLTREDIVRMTRLTVSTLYKIETGRMKRPSFELISEIAKALNISMDELTN